MLYLIGFTGVGKTTIGKKLAKQHSINFIDTDSKIEQITKKKISDIFKENGEEFFRKIEEKTIKEISTYSIVACGGGLPCYNQNINYIKQSGISIYLEASEEELFNRLSKSLTKRPLIAKKDTTELRKYIKRTLKKREISYLMADYRIDTTNLSINTVLRKINSLSITI